MRARIRVFVDSNVVVSALKSSVGAAYALGESDVVERIVSNLSEIEILKTVSRLKLDDKQMEIILKQKFTKVKVENNLPEVVKKFGKYVGDMNDSHVIAGAVISKASYLVTHNLKHFNTEKIKRELDIIVMSPGTFLQYLRSIS